MRIRNDHIAVSFGLVLAIGIGAPSGAQVNKEHVAKAPKEERVPMPHLDPENPDVIKLREDPARDMWREKRDYSKDPQRAPGPVKSGLSLPHEGTSGDHGDSECTWHPAVRNRHEARGIAQALMQWVVAD